ncbi:GAP family protein [Mycolicibacterium pulveris]|uniref:GAP family protein n=1 Tax=Mycolicibacterium pulveris TaxID=36813 RepID=UPI003CFB3058
MWGSLLALALVGSLNPVRLAATLLVSSQPRPRRSLFVYWVGSLMMGVLALVVPLVVLHFTPALKPFTQEWAAPQSSPTVRYVQLGIGVLALAGAALIAVGSLTHRERLSRFAMASDGVPALLRDDPTVRPEEAQDTLSESGSAIGKLLGRARGAWQNGSLWVSWTIGLLMGPAPDVVLFALAVIVASGAAIGIQIFGAVAYVLGVLGVVEAILLSYLVNPPKTQAALRRLHRWAAAHRRKLLALILLVVGLSMLAHSWGA